MNPLPLQLHRFIQLVHRYRPLQESPLDLLRLDSDRLDGYALNREIVQGKMLTLHVQLTKTLIVQYNIMDGVCIRAPNMEHRCPEILCGLI